MTEREEEKQFYMLEWQSKGQNDRPDSIIHVRDDSVCDDEEHEVVAWRRHIGRSEPTQLL